MNLESTKLAGHLIVRAIRVMGNIMVERTVTRTIEGSIERELIFALLKDPARIPEWAPAFADEVLPLGDNSWKVLKLGESFFLTVAIEPSSWTVDYLRTVAPGVQGGAFIRLLPRPGGGTVITMTLPIPGASDANQVGRILETELSALLALAESEKR